MNHCVIQGRVAAPPRPRRRAEGTAASADMTIIVPGFKDDEPAMELPVLLWGQQADAAINALRGGELVTVEGRLGIVLASRVDGERNRCAELSASRLHVSR